jgi:hypothetical protein
MKAKQTAKPATKAKKPATRKSSTEDLPVGERQAKDVKGGAARPGR